MPVGPSYVDCSSLSRSTSSGSVAVPVTGIGRVCGVSASSAPRVTTSSAAELVAGGQQLGAELPPPHVGLDAADQDDVAVQRRAGEAIAIWVLGQVIRRCPFSSTPTIGPVDLEVVVVLGVDGADDPRVPHLHQVIDGGRGGVRGVVPALERRDDDRIHQVRDTLELDHVTSVVRPGISAGRTLGVTIWESGPGRGRCS